MRHSSFITLNCRLAVMAICGLLSFTLPVQAATFRFSSIGYHPQGSKIAILEDVPVNQKLELALYDPTRRNPKFPVLLGATVYSITNVRDITDKNQQGPATRTLLLDFSDFKEPGNYEIHLEGSNIKSEPIKINEFLYWDTLKPVIKSFYFQRCGQDVEERSLKMFHAACHLKDAQDLSPTHREGSLDDAEEGQDVIGGWHNGGDYAKYVTSTGLSAARMMAMDEWNPKPYQSLHLDYPIFEPDYGKIDDLHHEIKAGLEWLMSMQRPDGALYRKVAGKQWPGKVKPENDDQPRFLYGFSTQDTAIAAATWAMAARDFKKSNLGYSIKCLMTAEKAWNFLENRPGSFIQRSANDFSGSGEFISPNNASDVPYRLWAAAELYVATGKTKYHQYFLNHLSEVPVQRFSWMNPALQGAGDYLLYAKNQDAATAENLRKSILYLADNIANQIASDTYGTGLSRYGSSSNVEVAENGAVLMLAYRLSGQVEYRNAASRLVSYFFGVNPTGMTYVTGLSGKSVQHPAHRWMDVTGKVLPGYLVDGPNEAPTDGKTPKAKGPASYVDDAAAQSVNESKLLNNASLAYLLGVLNDSYNASTGSEKIGPKSPLDFELAPERPKRNKPR